jgi:hypothetical protein
MTFVNSFFSFERRTSDSEHNLRQPLPGSNRIFQRNPRVTGSGEIGNFPELGRTSEVRQISCTYGFAVFNTQGNITS